MALHLEDKSSKFYSLTVDAYGKGKGKKAEMTNNEFQDHFQVSLSQPGIFLPFLPVIRVQGPLDLEKNIPLTFKIGKLGLEKPNSLLYFKITQNHGKLRLRTI